MKLSTEDRKSDLWRRLKEHFEERVSTFRVTNEDQSLNEKDTAAIRARIAELKYLLSIEEVAEEE